MHGHPDFIDLDTIARQSERVRTQRRDINFDNGGFTRAVRNVSKLADEQTFTVKKCLRRYIIGHVYLLSVSLKIQGQALDEY
jgi:hypothetical protein